MRTDSETTRAGQNLHNAFGAIVERNDVYVFPKLAHFLVHLNCDIDIRMLRVLPQVSLDAVLQVFVRAARGNTNGPIDVAEARRSMSALEKKHAEVQSTGFLLAL